MHFPVQRVIHRQKFASFKKKIVFVTHEVLRSHDQKSHDLKKI